MTKSEIEKVIKEQNEIKESENRALAIMGLFSFMIEVKSEVDNNDKK